VTGPDDEVEFWDCEHGYTDYQPCPHCSPEVFRELNPQRIDEKDLRVDVYSPAVLPRADSPSTWPAVRVTHIPTGITATNIGQSQLVGKAKAIEEIAAQLADEEIAPEPP
jgi:protein subunit release factor A